VVGSVTCAMLVFNDVDVERRSLTSIPLMLVMRLHTRILSWMIIVVSSLVGTEVGQSEMQLM